MKNNSEHNTSEAEHPRNFINLRKSIKIIKKKITLSRFFNWNWTSQSLSWIPPTLKLMIKKQRLDNIELTNYKAHSQPKEMLPIHMYVISKSSCWMRLPELTLAADCSAVRCEAAEDDEHSGGGPTITRAEADSWPTWLLLLLGMAGGSNVEPSRDSVFFSLFR